MEDRDFEELIGLVGAVGSGTERGPDIEEGAPTSV